MGKLVRWVAEVREKDDSVRDLGGLGLREGWLGYRAEG
jgi:hypothetical protein